MKPPRRHYGLLAVVVTLIVLASLQIQFHHLKEDRLTGDRTFATTTTTDRVHWRTGAEGLPRGIVHSNSDMYLRPLWDSGANRKNKNDNHNALLAMAVGISQMQNVDIMARKFLNQNYTVMLFHYDGNVDGWHNLEWSDKAIHILARNQTKWWFAKRFLHPDVVAIYGFIFLWDEDLGVDSFDPRRYLDIMVSEGLEITQPALDPDLSADIHHRITIRNKMTKVHRRIYDNRASMNCSDGSKGPPCTGWVEGMAPVFSRAAWRCVWHLIQNDLIHGWGLDMKLGYCAQGDRAEKVGVIDSEYVVHQGIPSLGGPSLSSKTPRRSLDLRTHIRRQSSAELEKFKERWNRAVREDEEWTDPFDT
uniref:Lysine ketoglutarate reductase trans-splicing related 1 n=1 Tax=Oryza punctata TaxID=4537 RepID=A0A0E0LG08_ORYPU